MPLPVALYVVRTTLERYVLAYFFVQCVCFVCSLAHTHTHTHTHTRMHALTHTHNHTHTDTTQA